MMGVMAKEIKKLRGRSAYLKAQDALDTMGEARVHRVVEDNNAVYLKQLYYGMEQLLERVMDQEQTMRELVSTLKGHGGARKMRFKTLLRPRRPKPNLQLNTALHLIRNNIDRNGRITWRKVNDPKQLIFAYLCKAESEGIDIASTMTIQDLPEYRRAFQYVAYKIGSWKDIISEYREVYR
jgi:hypothetical protein